MTKPRSWFIQTEYMVDTETIYLNLKYNWLCRLKKKMHSLKVGNYVLFRRLPEDYSPGWQPLR